jgi:hypothetical protein
MDKEYGDSRYQSRFVEDRQEGFAGYRLMRTRFGESKDVAQVTFWDAAGQFYIETFGEDIPFAIARELMAEAEQNINVR